MDRRVCSCKKWELTRIPCEHDVAAIYNMSENSVGVAKAISEGEFKKKIGRVKCDLLINNICEVFNRQLVDGKDQPIITCLEYIIEYLMKRIVVVQKVIAKTVGPLTPSVIKIFDGIKRLLSTMFNGMERKKSNDEIASQNASLGKHSRMGTSVIYGKFGNVGHNRKGCRGQGGGSSQADARKVSGQDAGLRKVSSQAVGARNISGQAAGARKASSQPSVTQSTTNQGPMQVIPAEIGMPTLRTTEVDMVKNNEALGIILDLLEEKREEPAI
nr:hypothetical protein [Tanacetum cinerariifolium]